MHIPRAVFLVLALAFAVPGSAATIEDHPAISRYAGSTLARRDNDGFRSYRLVTAVDEKGKSDEEALTTISVEGKLTRLAYENPRDRSAHEIFVNYRQALEKAGYRILFSCQAAACGPAYASSRWSRVTGLRYVSPDMSYLAARSDRGSGGIHVAVLVAKLRHQVEVVEGGTMETGRVTAQDIAAGLLADGRVVLDGIFFDTDKATIRPDSRPALEVIGGYLRNNPALKVYIVGHTDGTGTFEHNSRLSKERAVAVAADLQTTYGIAAERMAAHGVGPLSPVKPNQSEGGRAQNRRVEMVQR